MSLIICPECGKQISDKSERCIHCGFPLSSKVVEWEINNRERTENEKKEFLDSLNEKSPKLSRIQNHYKKKKKKNISGFKIVGLSIVILFATFIISVIIAAIFSMPNDEQINNYQHENVSSKRSEKNIKTLYSKVFLNVRAEPNTKSKVLKTLKPNEEVITYDTIKDGFTMILSADGENKIGWSANKYLQPDPLSDNQLKILEKRNNYEKLKYEIYSKKNISFGNFKGMVYRIILDVDVVPEHEQIKNIAYKIWKDKNNHWDKFNIFFYLPDMDIGGPAYSISEFTNEGLQNFNSGFGREVGTEIIRENEHKLQELVSKSDKVSQPKNEIRYVSKELNGWKYNEVVTIETRKKQKIYYDLVKYQDTTGDDVGAYSAMAKRHNIPEKAVKAIAFEGALKKWPIPDSKPQYETSIFIDPYSLKGGDKLSVSKKTPLMPEIKPSDTFAALEKIKYVLPGNNIEIKRVVEKDYEVWYFVETYNPNDRYLGFGWINSVALIGQDLRRVK